MKILALKAPAPDAIRQTLLARRRAAFGLSALLLAPAVVACEGEGQLDTSGMSGDAIGSTTGTGTGTAGDTGAGSTGTGGDTTDAGDVIEPLFACHDLLSFSPQVDKAQLAQQLSGLWHYGSEPLYNFMDNNVLFTNEVEVGATGTWALQGGVLDMTMTLREGQQPMQASVFDTAPLVDDSAYGLTEEIRRLSTVAVEGTSLHMLSCGTSVLRRVGVGTGIDGLWVGTVAVSEVVEYSGERDKYAEVQSFELQITNGTAAVKFSYCGAFVEGDEEEMESGSSTERGTVVVTGNTFEVEFESSNDDWTDWAEDTEESGWDDETLNETSTGDWGTTTLTATATAGSTTGIPTGTSGDTSGMGTDASGSGTLGGSGDWGETTGWGETGGDELDDWDDSGGSDADISGRLIDANTMVIDSFYYSNVSPGMAALDSYCVR